MSAASASASASASDSATPTATHDVSSGLLIRKPVADVFEAVVNPSITTRFWFSDSTGRLEEGKVVKWTWGWFGFSMPIVCIQLETNKRVVHSWGTPSGAKVEAEWSFEPVESIGTFVRVRVAGLRASDLTPASISVLTSDVQDQTQGFALVLAGMKAWLEHGVQLNLVEDHALPRK